MGWLVLFPIRKRGFKSTRLGGVKYVASEKRGRWEWNLKENERVSIRVGMDMLSWLTERKDKVIKLDSGQDD